MKKRYINLDKNLFFKGIEGEEIEKLLDYRYCTVVDYNKEEIIALEEDNCTAIGLILEGKIQIGRVYSSGKEIVLKKLKAGDVFGEALVFSKEEEYPATVIAIEKSKVMFIKREEILRLCSSNKIILENFLSLLSEKIIMLNNKIKIISQKSVKHRVINYILEQSKKQKSNNIILKESKENIAANLAIPRPSFSRELINLKKKGYIDYNRNNITIINKDALEELLFN